MAALLRFDQALLVAAALCGAAAVAIALRSPPLLYPHTTATLMARLAADGDGWLTREEYLPLTPDGGSILLLDRDGDGRLGAWEVELMLLTVNPDFHREAMRDR